MLTQPDPIAALPVAITLSLTSSFSEGDVVPMPTLPSGSMVRCVDKLPIVLSVPKDIRSWWSNRHHDRLAGVRSVTPTAWVPRSKPVWLTEVGCPAVDLGANKPNVFFDGKSSESALPPGSRHQRHPFARQRRDPRLTNPRDLNAPLDHQLAEPLKPPRVQREIVLAEVDPPGSMVLNEIFHI